MADEVREVEVQLADNEIVPAKLFIWDEAPDNRDLVKLILQFTGKEISSNDPYYFGAQLYSQNTGGRGCAASLLRRQQERLPIRHEFGYGWRLQSL